MSMLRIKIELRRRRRMVIMLSKSTTEFWVAIRQRRSWNEIGDRTKAEKVTCIAGWPWEGWNPSGYSKYQTPFYLDVNVAPLVPIPPTHMTPAPLSHRCWSKRPHPQLSTTGIRIRWKAIGLSFWINFQWDVIKTFSWNISFTSPDARLIVSEVFSSSGDHRISHTCNC